MKVLHVIERFYPLVGGAEMQALQLIKKLKANGVKIDVLARRIDKNLKKYEVIEGIAIYRLKPTGFKASKFKFAWNVYKFIKKGEYDIIHVHGIYSFFGMSCVLAGKKVIGKITNSREILKQNKIKKAFKLLVLRKIDKIIAISNQVKSEIQRMGFKSAQIIAIPNGVDTKRFKPGLKKDFRERLNLPFNKQIAVFSGKLVGQKGLDILLKCLGEVVNEYPNLLLLVFGTGRLQEESQELELKNYVKRNGISGNVKFMGNVWNLEDYLKASDFFFFPSRREGLPNALLEAAASGLPVIASKIGGNVDIIQDGHNGLLFESENVKDLKKKMRLLLKDKGIQIKFGKNARRVTLNKFSLDKVCKKYLELYNSLVN